MLRVLMILGAVALSAAVKTTTQNEAVDEVFRRKNLVHPERVPLSFNITIPGKLELQNGMFVGFNTLQRTGDVTVTEFDNSTMMLDYHFGFKKFEGEYMHAKLDGQRVVGVFSARKNSIHLTVYVHFDPEEGNCDAWIGEFGIERLDKVLFQPIDGPVRDVSELFSNEVRPELNRIMVESQMIKEISNGIKVPICQNLRMAILLRGLATRERRSVDDFQVAGNVFDVFTSNVNYQ